MIEAVDPTRPIDIAITGRLRNGHLWRAVQRFGSNKKVAELLGVTEQAFCRWLNLEGCPSSVFIQSHEKTIVHVLGALPEDIWPDALRGKRFRQSNKKFARHAQVTEDQLLSLESSPHLTTKHLAIEPPLVPEEMINDALKTLTPREETVLRMRYGLDDGHEKTLDEIGAHLMYTGERIGLIEQKALRKLRHPARSKAIREELKSRGW